MQTRERIVDGDVEAGAWMSSNILGHEIAIMRDGRGAHGRLHHVAFFYGIQQHTIDAAEMFRDYDITIEAGPDRHGITQGAFLYVFEPGGNRIELFGDPGFLELEPDFETKTWTMADIDTATAIGGTKLPAETYFVYGTPPVPVETSSDTTSAEPFHRDGAGRSLMGSFSRPIPNGNFSIGLVCALAARAMSTMTCTANSHA